MLDLLLDGKTAGPGGDWPALAQAMGGAPVIAEYLAPLALFDEGMSLGVAVQATACLRHQPDVAARPGDLREVAVEDQRAGVSELGAAAIRARS